MPLSDSTIIMTSNSENIVPAREDDGAAAVGFGTSNHNRADRYLQQAKDAIEEFFPAEFMDGVDEVLLFDSLSDGTLREIVQIHLESIHERLALRSISLEVSDSSSRSIRPAIFSRAACSGSRSVIPKESRSSSSTGRKGTAFP